MAASDGGTVTRVQPSAFGCITIPFLLIALIPLGWTRVTVPPSDAAMNA